MSMLFPFKKRELKYVLQKPSNKMYIFIIQKSLNVIQKGNKFWESKRLLVISHEVIYELQGLDKLT